MAVTAEKIAHLRAVLSKPDLAPQLSGVRLGDVAVDAVLKDGLHPALHEVFAPPGHEVAATGFAVGLARRLAPEKCVLWVMQEFSAREYAGLCATGLLEFGLSPSRLIMLSARHVEDALRAAGDALTCKGLGAVIIEINGNPKVLNLTATRRLLLASEQHGVAALLVRLGAEEEASAAETRWRVSGACSDKNADLWGEPVFDVRLIRNRHGRTGRWRMAWSCDDGRFRTAEASGTVVSLSSGREAEAA
ncbi:ImuA family protein [Aestuariivirga sp.]|uniref:ImuA family protein n=1 Tax=Aestuariivirga sp. TaxID=2650926 RepID=UPI0039E41127